VALSPVVRRLAAEKGLDLAAISGSGAGGRIRREDVERAIAAQPAAAAPAPSSAVAAAPPAAVQAPAAAPAPVAAQKPAASVSPGDEVVKLSRMRLITADLMVKSLKTSAHVWTSVEVDFEHVEQVRQRHREQFKKTEGMSLTYLPFIARAVCDALREFPAVNASIDIENQTMTMHHYVNLGIAVDLSEQGLVAPVVKNADSLNIRGLARNIAAVAAGARARTLAAADMSGSTFTITNPGPFASYASAPVINQPNVAILSTDGIARRPVAVGDAIAIHHMSILGFSYDHRAFDGSTASLFLRYVRDAIQDRGWDAELS
jgi:2-oxoglutarate dehydrogenase E2 component (dihydrolipoamide succinyltransferase)